jgi:1-acyl-sn-glycerol-3-phosphate acyltransferase
MSLSYIRSLLITDPIIIFATIVMGSISLLSSLFDSDGRIQHQISRVWSRMLLKVSGVKMEIEGLEKIDPRGTYVFVANHRSLMDIPVLLAHLPLQFRFFAKKGLFHIPFLGTHLRRSGHLPVVKDNPRASLHSMSEAVKTLQVKGMSMLLFPEGGRSKDGQLQEFIEGSAYIAIKAGISVIPIAMTGTREVLPMGSMQIMQGLVQLRIGNPILTATLTGKDRHALSSKMHEKIAELLCESTSQAQTR